MSAFAVDAHMTAEDLIRQLERSFEDVSQDEPGGKRTRNIINPEQVKIMYNYFVRSAQVAAALTAAVAAANKIGITKKDIIIAMLYFVASIVDTGVILVSAAASQVASAAGTCVSIVGSITETTFEAVSTLLGYFTVENVDFAAGIAVGAAQGVAANAAYVKLLQYNDDKYVMFQDIADTINSLYDTGATAVDLLRAFRSKNLLLYTPDDQLNPQPSTFLDVGQCAAASTPLSENLERFKQSIIDRNNQKLTTNAAIINQRSASFNLEQSEQPALTDEEKRQYCANQTIRNAIAERRRIIVSNAFLELGLPGMSATNVRLSLPDLQEAVNEAIEGDELLKRYLLFNTVSCPEEPQSQGYDAVNKRHATGKGPYSLPFGGRGRRTKSRKSYRKAYKKRTHKRRHGKTHKNLLKRKRRRTRK
jgi:hypothetical protein